MPALAIVLSAIGLAVVARLEPSLAQRMIEIDPIGTLELQAGVDPTEAAKAHRGGDDVPLPPFWGGYLVAPETVDPETVALQTVAPETVVAESSAPSEASAGPETVAAPEATATAEPETSAAPQASAGTETPAATEPSGALPLANYDELSVASLRARLRNLTNDDLTQLMAYEKAHQDRPEVIKMFQNRLVKMTTGLPKLVE